MIIDQRDRMGRAACALAIATSALACSGAEETRVDALSARLSSSVVISQVYGGGSNSGAPLSHDYIELYNRGDTSVSLDGLSLQYASATGTGLFGATATQLTELPAISLAPGQYALVQQAGGTSGSALPGPDHVDPTPIAMSATAGKVALVTGDEPLGCNGGSVPCSADAAVRIVDLVGYGGANFFEGSGPAPAASNTMALFRGEAGELETDDNATDFSAATPAPRNGQSEPPPPPLELEISEIQGAQHRSAFVGKVVQNVPGVVTAIRSNGFYLQDPHPDGDAATSEALFAFTGTAPNVAVGDAVLVAGTVAEFRPGGSGGTNNLTLTELTGPSVRVVSHGNPLPAPVLIGAYAGARPAPTTVIDNDAPGDVETEGATFDPAEDGIDFYESLEGMRVEIRDAVAVSPTREFSGGSRELVVLPDGGAGASVRTARGGIVVRPDDFNPERIFLANTLVSELPLVNVGDTLPGSIQGIIDYSFGNFKLLYTSALPSVVPGGLTREITHAAPTRATEISIASFNVENLDPLDPAEKFAALAASIVTNLKAPDILTLEEVQDDNGPTNDAVVSAELTLRTLVGAISVAGGPSYEYRSIDPVDDQDGGEPGGNIRVAFLFRIDRGLNFVDRGDATALEANTVLAVAGQPELSHSPGRIDPQNIAFANSRKPLAGEFMFNGRKLFVIANHLNSKGGDQPLFGRFQPPALSSEAQRMSQAQLVADFVDRILAIDPSARVLVAGDLNDFEFSPPLELLRSAGLTPLIETLPPNERYSYVFDGNSQTLDHILASRGILNELTGFDVVHINAEFAEQTSDHDPNVARFRIAPSGQPVVPRVDCVRRSGTRFTAVFSYSNPNPYPIAIDVGPSNRFWPAPEGRGQPNSFAPGSHPAVEVSFNGLPLTWLLQNRLAVASALSPRCR